MTHSKVKILVVEDNRLIQDFMQKALNFINYENTIIKNGLQALELLADHGFDLILLDLEMPVMKGTDCIQTIRSLPDKKKANTPIVCITSNSSELSNQDFNQLGFTDIALKPINFVSFKKTIEKYLLKQV